MPPKKASKAKGSNLPSRSKEEEDDSKAVGQAAEAENKHAPEEPETVAEEDADDTKDTNATASSKKRKAPPTSGSKPPKKEPRQGTRTSSRTTTGSTTKPSTSTPAGPSSAQLLNYLLSKDSLPLCFPADELSAATSNKKLRTYSLTSPTEYTAFEALIIAHLLSKPLSHTLGMRSIRTLLNPPYSLNTPSAIVDAGETRVWEALESARTQHRQKTASYIHEMAKTYTDSETMFALAEAANDDGPQGVIRHITETVNGMGQTGAELFCRRIQAVDGWGEAVWPFADGKCLDALREIGVEVKDGEELQGMLERYVDWSKVRDMGLNEKEVARGELVGEEMEAQVQAEFVVVLERAVCCKLEGKVGELRRAAADWK